MKIFKSPLSKLPTHRRFNYVPRHYDPQKEEWEKKKKARSLMVRGAFYEKNNSRLIGAFDNNAREAEDDYLSMERASKFRQFSGVILLSGIMFCPVAYLFLGISPWIAGGIALTLLYLFVRR